ncbi:MAG: PTS lactose/cellobiose transporter subunit IIA [Erysipelotrichaceae bacterium]|nr:PTS lactose/cellobiose transporter subunit IIA [Erysipelotrichaceae bacterium]
MENFDINRISMEVILNAGDGRELIDQALDAIADQEYGKAETLLEEAEEKITIAHRVQTQVIQSHMAGESIEYSLLFIHAQDTIMTINTELRMTQKMLSIFKKQSKG